MVKELSLPPNYVEVITKQINHLINKTFPNLEHGTTHIP